MSTGVMRSPLGRVAEKARREAVVEAAGVAAAARGAATERGQRLSGQDDGSGNWEPYGLLDVTPLSGFKLS